MGETFRRNRGFLFTRLAPAHGRDQTMPKGFVKHDLTRRADNTENRPRDRLTAESLIGVSALGGEKGVVFADGVPRRRRMVSGLKQSFRERIR